MNTKKNKNKQKQHKPPTPQPKAEISGVSTEKSEQVQENPDSIKCEERVPEIVSEIVQPILEPKVSESDAPKKPKRHRGKKKKGDKGEETDEMEEQNIDEPALEQIKDEGDKQESKDSNVTETKVSVTEVTPAARKKKNKNKKHSEQSDKPSDQEVKIAPIKKDEELTDLKIVTVVPVATEEESKSKKKHKKKKRTDSERSDRAEEVISCTSAFQKLLESKDEKKDTKTVNKQENIAEGDKPAVCRSKEQSVSIKPEIQAPVDKEILKPEIAARDKSTENKNEPKEESGKGKRKNKREKKHTPKEESEDESFKPLQTKTEIDSEGQTVTVVTDSKIVAENVSQQKTEVKVDEKPSVQMPTIEKEKSPKPKAKIAKPVEKKRKEQAEMANTESVKSETGSETILLEEKLKEPVNIPAEKIQPELISGQQVEKSVSMEDTKEDKPIDICVKKVEQISQVVSDSDKIGTEVNLDMTKQIKGSEPETEKMKIPDSGSSKKRKKSPKPKPSDIVESNVQPVSIIPPTAIKPADDMDSSISGETIESADTKTKMIKAKSNIPEPTITQINEPIPLSFEVTTPQNTAQVQILQTPEGNKEQEIKKISETSVNKEDVATDKSIENIQLPETMGKKRKKSPKPQKKPAIEIAEHATCSTKVLKDTSETKKQNENKNIKPKSQVPEKEISQLKTDSSTDLPTLEDIEISSVKADESEGSTCDIIPDVQYPRASSQHDDNNNTVIRDVTMADVKLNISTYLPDTPLIEGSGETPVPQAGTPYPSVTIMEMGSSVHKQEEAAMTSKSTENVYPITKHQEKTDLKSKVLDVNQGMEELRRSIERSLAELSSMEKNEKEAEDQFFKAQVKLEQITQMASKKLEERQQTLPTDLVKQTQEKTAEQQTQLQNPVEEKKKEESKLPSKMDEPKVQPIPQQPLATQELKHEEQKTLESTMLSETQTSQVPPVPARKDNKGKGKKKKGKQDFESCLTATPTSSQTESSSGATTSSTSDTKEHSEDSKKSEQKTDNKNQEKGKQQPDNQNKGKQQSASFADDTINENKNTTLTDSAQMDFEPIENFEDALYASIGETEQDVNKTFEIIANEAVQCDESQNPEINVTAPTEDEDDTAKDKKEQEKVNPLSQPKNLLGHPDIPARLNRIDYKKEKNKHQTPNTKQATVKIKDAVPIEVTKESKESQTENKRRFLKDKTVTESITSMTSENEEYVYKYSFRKVFLPSACHVCKKDLKVTRVPCNFCNLIFYCSMKHKDEDYPQHQGLCFAVSTIVHLRDQKHIYADAKNITGHAYRLLRMQMIVSCEKVLKRRLVPWEQEALLYPRMCADASCREWRQNKLVDCVGCGQISYCSDDPTHLPKTHQRWCKSYSLYNKLVVYQQTKGRLEPKLPTRVMAELYQIPGKLNEVLASMYEEKIDMTDIQYAALTQIATAPLTAAYCHQLYGNKMNTIYANGVCKKSSFTIHVVGAELQFEADALNKWEVFFLHLRPDVKDLRVVLLGPDLNPSKLPLDLLARIKLCENCRQNKRRVIFDFHDKKTYHEYWSTDFTTPDVVCAFNPSIQRSSVFNGKDIWPSTIKCILKLKVPFIITSYTMSELQNDLTRIKECSEIEVNTITEPEFNAFASVRPDRNFISDDEMPLLFKNFCFATVCGAF